MSNMRPTSNSRETSREGSSQSVELSRRKLLGGVFKLAAAGVVLVVVDQLGGAIDRVSNSDRLSNGDKVTFNLDHLTENPDPTAKGNAQETKQLVGYFKSLGFDVSGSQVILDIKKANETKGLKVYIETAGEGYTLRSGVRGHSNNLVVEFDNINFGGYKLNGKKYVSNVAYNIIKPATPTPEPTRTLAKK